MCRRNIDSRVIGRLSWKVLYDSDDSRCHSSSSSGFTLVLVGWGLVRRVPQSDIVSRSGLLLVCLVGGILTGRYWKKSERKASNEFSRTNCIPLVLDSSRHWRCLVWIETAVTIGPSPYTPPSEKTLSTLQKKWWWRCSYSAHSLATPAQYSSIKPSWIFSSTSHESSSWP